MAYTASAAIRSKAYTAIGEISNSMRIFIPPPPSRRAVFAKGKPLPNSGLRTNRSRIQATERIEIIISLLSRISPKKYNVRGSEFTPP